MGLRGVMGYEKYGLRGFLLYALRPRRRSRLPHITRPSRLAARRSACGACEVCGCIESENADQ